jgi:hypothetical protein
LVLVVCLQLNILGVAQNDPTSPTGGGVETPFIIKSETTKPTTGGQSSAVPVEQPATPTIVTEEIEQDSGQTLPVEVDGKDFNLNNPDPATVQKPVNNPSTGSVNTTNPEATTVRSGGLENTLIILSVLAIGGFWYYYNKKNKSKKSLKTNEKKLKY